MKKKILSVGLIAAVMFGLNTINANAVGKTYVDTLPETITRGSLNNFANDGQVNDAGFAPVNFMLSKDGEYILYCADRSNTAMSPDDILTKDEKLDYKIAYLVKNGYPKNNLISGVNGWNTNTSSSASPITDYDANSLANYWITQVGLWSLQGTVPSTSTLLSSNQIRLSLESAKWYSLCYDASSMANCETNEDSIIGGVTLEDYVNKLVKETNSASDPSETTLNINFDNKWELVDDTYKSSVFEVVSSNSDVTLGSLSFDLSNAANGTKLYAENGTDLTDSANAITGVTKFYLTIPKSEVSSGNSNFKISTSANITYDAAYQYIDKVNGHQPSVLVGPETKQLNNVMSITIVPDTASIISKSIYFVGFILLTFGAGIIYINIKQNNEEV